MSERHRQARWIPLALGLLALGLVAPLLGQKQKFSESTDVVLVEVPVQVTDKNGDPIRGLTAADFEILDGKKPQEIVQFEVIDLMSAELAERPKPVPIAARRHFLLLFDMANSQIDSIVRARQAAFDLLRGLHPTDLVAVATYSLLHGADLVISFTSDRWQVEQAIRSLGSPELLKQRSSDPLALTIAEREGSSDEGSISEDMDSLAAEHVQEMNRLAAQADREALVSEAKTYAKRLKDLARVLDSVEGRKHVVLLSEGFSTEFLTGEQIQGGASGGNRAVESGRLWEVDSQERYGNTELQNDIEDMLEEFRRADVIIQSVDIGGLRAGGDVRGQRGDGKGSLVTMARGTGGGFFENFNRLDEAMAEMIQSTSVTYLLAFQPKDLAPDGSYHKLKVRLKNGPRGARIDHRAGYYAPKPLSERLPIEQRFDLAEVVMSGYDQGTVEANVLATPIRVPGEPAYVPVLIEVDGPSFVGGFEGESLNAEIFGYALNDEGEIIDTFSEIAGMDMAKLGPSLLQKGFKFYGHLDLDPGTYSVRALVRNGATGDFALRVATVAVPEEDSAAPSLSPPLVPEPLGTWLMVREGEAAQKERQVDFPFMLGDQPFLPAARPRLAPREKAQVCLLGYNLDDKLEVEAWVTDHEGNEVKGGKVTVDKQPKRTKQGDQLLGELDTKGLSPGEYQLQVTVRHPANGSASSSIPFEVVKR